MKFASRKEKEIFHQHVEILYEYAVSFVKNGIYDPDLFKDVEESHNYLLRYQGIEPITAPVGRDNFAQECDEEYDPKTLVQYEAEMEMKVHD